MRLICVELDLTTRQQTSLSLSLPLSPSLHFSLSISLSLSHSLSAASMWRDSIAITVHKHHLSNCDSLSYLNVLHRTMLHCTMLYCTALGALACVCKLARRGVPYQCIAPLLSSLPSAAQCLLPVFPPLIAEDGITSPESLPLSITLLDGLQFIYYSIVSLWCYIACDVMWW
jgi:hypothetical protein